MGLTWVLSITISSAHAATINSTAIDGVNVAGQITKPVGMLTIVKAVNVTGPADTVNDVELEADTLNFSASPPKDGNGYTTYSPWGADDLSPYAIAGANFTNTGHNTLSNSLAIDGHSITILPNTDYVFEAYFVSAEDWRSTDVSYAIGATSGYTHVMHTAADKARRLRVSFTTDTETTFDWAIGNFGDGNNSAMLSAYALYQGESNITEDPSAVPEPATFVLAAVGLAGLGVMIWRRRK